MAESKGTGGGRGWLRYGGALVAVAVTYVLKLPLDEAVGRGAPFQLFSLAIVITAASGGLGPALLATALSTLLGSLSVFSLVPEPGAAALRIGLFLLQGVGISVIGHLLHQARRRSETALAILRADMEERERLDHELALANRRATDLLEGIHDLFFSVDREWRFTYVNGIFARALGEEPEEMVGKIVWEAYPSLLGSIYEECYRRAVREQQPVRFDAPGTMTGRWYRVYAYPTDDGLAVFSTDIEDQVQAQREREEQLARIQELAYVAQEAQAEAEKANRMKDQFLATLSHELRTPLNAILGWAQILRAGRLDASGMARGLEVIERSSRAQAQLIGDLLDISRITSGKLRLETRPVDLEEVLEAALAAVVPAAGSRGIAIERFFDPGLGPVNGDPDRLQQVFWNLLSNAVKFTPQGGRVEVHLEAVGEQARVRVQDSGQGIAPELLAHVFDLFRQGDGASSLRQGGLGLGLAIVRELVELQGGHVGAESPGPGRGATFSVHLPFAYPQAPAAAALPVVKEPARPPLAGLRLLAVDDEPDTLEVLAELLSLRGADVATASSAAQALEVLPAFGPDVLVSDISMPGRDGYDLIREIRTGRPPESLPAVAVTAFASSEDRKRALAAGFQVHLAKPVDPAELVDVIARLAESSRGGNVDAAS